jgi:uncharacterized protein (TIGR02217 family)
MSNAILPLFPGVSWGVIKRPLWATNVADAVSGRQYSLRRRIYPLWQFKLPYEVLRSTASLTEMQQIVGFFNARNGRYDDFLFQDPRENSVTAQAFGVGDALTRTFELVRTYGGFAEPVGGVNTATLRIYVNGVLKTVTTDYTISSDWRYITFTVAPAASAALTWTGSYYYRCRFLNDDIPFEEFMQYKHKTDIEFRSYRA